MVMNQVQPLSGVFNGGCNPAAPFPTQIDWSESTTAQLIGVVGSDDGASTGDPGEIAPALGALREALADAVEAERDLCGMPNGMDPAVDAWIIAAEAARCRVISTAAGIQARVGDGKAIDDGVSRLAALTLKLLKTDCATELRRLREDLLGLEGMAHAMAKGMAGMWGDVAEAAAWLRVYLDLDPPMDASPLEWPDIDGPAAL